VDEKLRLLSPIVAAYVSAYALQMGDPCELSLTCLALPTFAKSQILHRLLQLTGVESEACCGFVVARLGELRLLSPIVAAYVSAYALQMGDPCELSLTCLALHIVDQLPPIASGQIGKHRSHPRHFHVGGEGAAERGVVR
jgi:hypothetical protein